MQSGQLTSAGQASRRRLLDAATAEFAAFGIAGARVDRICAVAQVNKAQLYAYFGNKDQLFDAVLLEHTRMIVDTVPLDGEDLPGYAVGLYDSYLHHPQLVRLATWARLERTPAGPLFDMESGPDADKKATIRAAQQAGHLIDTMDAAEILSLVTAMSMTWSPASAMIAATLKDPQADHDRRREALRASVARAFTP
ncbi:MAG TPA: TetR family transcriptional regulator [Streptomyces sp.]|nr:TetR family transcriptional regulator [Streptomyces sp.]